MCRPRHTPIKHSYTPAMDEQLREAYRTSTRKGELSPKIAALTAAWKIPRDSIINRAQKLGLARDIRKPWTAEERALLREEAGKTGLRELARMLGRNATAVAVKMREERLSYARSDAWTERELRRFFGVTALRIREWGTRGWLRPQNGFYERCDVLRFLINHPEAFDTRTIDVAWMRDMLRRIGVMIEDLSKQTQLAA